jgi:hypothetical protein
LLRSMLFPIARPAGNNFGANAAARAEIAFDNRPDRFGSFDDVGEHLVHDVFLKDSQIAVDKQIFLQRLEFEAGLGRHIANDEDTEVWKSGLGTDGGEFGDVDDNLISRKLVGPSFDGGETGVQASGGVRGGVCRFRHASLF